MTSVPPGTDWTQIDFDCPIFETSGARAIPAPSDAYLEVPVQGEYAICGVWNFSGLGYDYDGLHMARTSDDTTSLNQPETPSLTPLPLDSIPIDSHEFDLVAGKLVSRFDGSARFSVAIELWNGLFGPSDDEINITVRKNGTTVLLGLAHLRFDNAGGRDHGFLEAFDIEVAVGDTYELTGNAAGPLSNAITTVGGGAAPHTFLSATRLNKPIVSGKVVIFDSSGNELRTAAFDVAVGWGGALICPTVAVMIPAGGQIRMYARHTAGSDLSSSGNEGHLEAVLVGPYADSNVCAGAPPV